MLTTVLNCRRSLHDKWYSDYGMTADRSRNLIALSRTSFQHPGSETALTLFMLGNLDGWKQVGHFQQDGPRNATNKWNRSFFSAACGSVGIVDYPQHEAWSQLSLGVFGDKALDWSRSTLVFEFEVMNSKFHTINRKAFKSLSFLNIDGNKKWGAFDAFMIVPAIQPTEQFRGAFVGIEAKLASDISQHTKGFRYVNQIMRNVEAGYWLTHHPESLYRSWQFHYVFVCPKSDFEMKATYYAWLLADDSTRQEACVRYRTVLEYHGAGVDERNYDAFSAMVRNRVTVVHWNQIADVLHHREPGFFEKYFDALKEDQGLAEILKNSRLRLQRGGIEMA